MATNAVPGFQPSRAGLRFANRWPAAPAISWQLGLLHVGLGDTARGLCGGMAYVVRDRFERGQPAPGDEDPPAPGTALFREVVRRQIDSFDRLVVVPLRFWLAALRSPTGRARQTVRDAWPAIRREIDGGRLAVVGLLRTTSANPTFLGVNHQVLAYRYDASPDGVTLWIYDPNHPGDDEVSLRIGRAVDGGVTLAQSTGEPLHGLLALPYVPPAPAPPAG